ncbi:transcription initiation factor IIB [Malassezia vespertilionis]|uniref:Transcription initiation factor IIB n=1 Tax=Malassezia vespertilionis TaxID=2020962 RepID=A0A2N1JEB7_9BASI|nr:transcription initiation factor IIB [Malassezia vespertilionis]PKI84883.1 Sua7p [Malassezia vespertilionis]WFD05775.1 transcription initiation factor IIB [Malassezia vespertilionis]
MSAESEPAKAVPPSLSDAFAITPRFAEARAVQQANAGHMHGLAKPKKAQPHFLPDLNVRLLCPECQTVPPNITEEFASGDLVCADCGLVLGDRIVDTRSEWRTFANEDGDDPSRVGSAANPILDGITEQLESRIAARDGGTGTSRDLLRTMSRTYGSRDRSLLDAFDSIQNKCDSIHLPRTVCDTAKQAYRRVDQEKLLRGKHTDAIIAAAIYVACRVNRVPRTFPEVCALTSVRKQQVARCFREMKEAFGLNATGMGSVAGSEAAHAGAGPGPGTSGAGTPLGLAIGATDLVARYCNHLGLDMSIVRVTEAITNRIHDLGYLAGRSPITIAAASIYLVTILVDEQRTARRISVAAGVSDVTIKHSFKELLKVQDTVLTPDILAKDSRIDLHRLEIK